MYVFENPSDVTNSIIYFLLIISFTAVVLVFSKKSELILKIILYFLIFISVYYILTPFFGDLSLLLALIVTVLLLKRPNLLIINLSAFLLSVGITSIFGISLEPIPIIVLLIILAIYDFISVYKTKHMIDLADSISEMKLPLLFILPRKDEGDLKNRSYSVMGVGDVVIPNMLVVSAQVFSNSDYFLIFKMPALFSMLGGLLALSILLILTEKRPGAYPGLPFINAGAIAGYFASLVLF